MYSCVEARFEFYLKTRTRLAVAGFNLWKFMSNSPQLLERIHESERQMKCNSSGSHSETYKVLGIGWNPITDELLCDVDSVAWKLENLMPTK